jgi:hypothetical protein
MFPYRASGEHLLCGLSWQDNVLKKSWKETCLDSNVPRDAFVSRLCANAVVVIPPRTDTLITVTLNASCREVVCRVLIFWTCGLRISHNICILLRVIAEEWRIVDLEKRLWHIET